MKESYLVYQWMLFLSLQYKLVHLYYSKTGSRPFGAFSRKSSLVSLNAFFETLHIFMVIKRDRKALKMGDFPLIGT